MNIIVSIFSLKAKISSYFRIFYRKYITDIISIKSYKNGKISECIYNYYIFQMINVLNICLFGILNSYVNKLDIPLGKTCITKNYGYKEEKLICNNIEHLSDIQYKSAYKKDISPIIFSKFALITKNETICLKKYLFNYSDILEKYDNTLGNILLFEKIGPYNYTTDELTDELTDETTDELTDETTDELTDEMYVHIVKRDKNKRINKRLIYEECKNLHINHFINI